MYDPDQICFPNSSWQLSAPLAWASRLRPRSSGSVPDRCVGFCRPVARRWQAPRRSSPPRFVLDSFRFHAGSLTKTMLALVVNSHLESTRDTARPLGMWPNFRPFVTKFKSNASVHI